MDEQSAVTEGARSWGRGRLGRSVTWRGVNRAERDAVGGRRGPETCRSGSCPVVYAACLKPDVAEGRPIDRDRWSIHAGGHRSRIQADRGRERERRRPRAGVRREHAVFCVPHPSGLVDDRRRGNLTILRTIHAAEPPGGPTSRWDEGGRGDGRAGCAERASGVLKDERSDGRVR